MASAESGDWQGPMSREAFERNRNERQRLILLVGKLTESDLKLPVHGDWTIAAKFAHIAFWDRFCLKVLERWSAQTSFRIDLSDWYDDVLNDTVLVESLALEPAIAAQQAIDAVTALDTRLDNLGDSDTERLIADAGDPNTDATWLLHRYRHRSLHLDEIEAALTRVP